MSLSTAAKTFFFLWEENLPVLWSINMCKQNKSLNLTIYKCTEIQSFQIWKKGKFAAFAAIETCSITNNFLT